MEVELLQKIAKNTEHKTSFQIIVSGNEKSFNTRFNPKIELDREKVYEIALVNLETYYSFPNIDESNNIFVYSPDNGNSWVKIKIPEGSYEIDDINNTVQQEMKKRGHYNSINEDYPISISANSKTLKSVLILEKDYQVDFNHRDSLAKVLAFTGTKYTSGFHESENVVDILRINSVLVNIDIISGSYVNGATKNTIYSFFPKVSPGYKIIESPVNLVYLPMLAKTVLPALGVGALSGLASSGVQKAMGSGLYLKKGGIVSQVETDGHGLYLKPYKGKGLKSHGDGLYLK